MLDRLDTQSPRYSFALDAALVSLSMLLMWPRLLWVACRAFWDWLRSEWRDAMFWCSTVFLPFIFWLAPLLVLVRNRRRRGLSAFPPAFRPTVFLLVNVVGVMMNLLVVWAGLVLDKPLLDGFAPVGLLVVHLLLLVVCAIDLDHAVARVEAGEAA